ncbi:hypothetical protein RCL1_002407 [Eukaryota sp. TZLM3-RCL]
MRSHCATHRLTDSSCSTAPPNIDSFPSAIAEFLKHPDNHKSLNKLRQHLQTLHQKSLDEARATLQSINSLLCGCACKTEAFVDAGIVECCVRVLRRSTGNNNDPITTPISFFAASALANCFSSAPTSALQRLWDTGASDELAKLAKGAHTWLEERIAIKALFFFTPDIKLLRRLATTHGMVSCIIDSILCTPARILCDVIADPSKSLSHHHDYFLDITSQFSNQFMYDTQMSFPPVFDSCLVRSHAVEFLVDFREQSLSFLNMMTKDSLTLKGIDVHIMTQFMMYMTRALCVVPHSWTTLSVALSIYCRFLLVLDQSLNSLPQKKSGSSSNFASNFSTVTLVYKSGILKYLTSIIRSPVSSFEGIKLVTYLIKHYADDFKEVFSSLGVYSAMLDVLEGLFVDGTEQEKPCLEPGQLPSIFWALFNGSVVGEAALSLLLWVSASSNLLSDSERLRFYYYQIGYKTWKSASESKGETGESDPWPSRMTDHFSPFPSVPNSLSVATQLRSKGNELFRTGNYKEALAEYLSGLWRCPFTEVLQRRMFLSNISECCLRLKDYSSALSYATRGLFLGQGPLVEKCLYRRGKAYLAMGKYFEGYCDLLEAGVDARFREKVFKSIQELVKSVTPECTFLGLYSFKDNDRKTLLTILSKTMTHSPLLYQSFNSGSGSKVFSVVSIEETLSPPPVPSLLDLPSLSVQEEISSLQGYKEDFTDPLFPLVQQLFTSGLGSNSSSDVSSGDEEESQTEEESDQEEEQDSPVVLRSAQPMFLPDPDESTVETATSSGSNPDLAFDHLSESLEPGISLIHQLARSYSVDRDWIAERVNLPTINEPEIELSLNHVRHVDQNSGQVPALATILDIGLDLVCNQCWV